jgi:hypothetical protein
MLTHKLSRNYNGLNKFLKQRLNVLRWKDGKKLQSL